MWPRAKTMNIEKNGFRFTHAKGVMVLDDAIGLFVCAVYPSGLLCPVLCVFSCNRSCCRSRLLPPLFGVELSHVPVVSYPHHRREEHGNTTTRKLLYDTKQSIFVLRLLLLLMIMTTTTTMMIMMIWRSCSCGLY